MSRKIFICGTVVLLCSLNVAVNITARDNVTTGPEFQDYEKINGAEKESHHVSIHVASWRWSYVKTPLVLTIFVMCAGILKIGFHHANFLSSILPESCLLIILGVIVGAITWPISPNVLPHFNSTIFFLILLPPIIMEGAFSLYDRAFFFNFGTVLLFAVIGTIINFFLTGFSLYGFGALGGSMLQLSVVEALVFGALISAVDPVAVLAIFQEIGVNKDLYFLVFGESLLNDAVTVVIYNTMATFTKMTTISPDQYGLAVASFLVVNVGGLTCGIVTGVLTSVLTKFTETVRVVEPLAILGLGYFAFLFAELFHFSGIISIISCCLVQAQYAEKNISRKSYTTVKYFIKMLSSVCESIIFLFLGMVLVETHHVWHTSFILITLALCLVCRFLYVHLLSAIVNHYRVRKIDYEEQFIMAYGGLRGAVAFSLVLLLDSKFVHSKDIFVTTTLVVIIFTVFVQGITIKPLVKLLRIRGRSSEKLTLFNEVNDTLMNHIMAGVEEVSGSLGDFYYKEVLHLLNARYLKPYLVRSATAPEKLNKIYEKVTLSDHYANLYGPCICLEDKKPLANVINTKADLTGMVENMINNGPAVDLSAGVSNVEVELRQPSTLQRVQDRLKQSFPALNRQSDPGVVTKMRLDHREALKRALSNNPYEKLHRKYNKNLVNDDDQEMSTHLQRRCSNAKKLTSVILTPPLDTSREGNEERAGSASSVNADGRLEVYNVTQMLLDRATNTRRRARGRSHSEQSEQPKNVPVFSRSFSLGGKDAALPGGTNAGSPRSISLEALNEDPAEGGNKEQNKESKV